MDEEIKIEGNININQALKEFELKSSQEQIQKTPEVLQNSEVPKMVALVMKWFGGAIKEQKQAEYVLLGFVVVAIVISGYLFFIGGPSEEKINPPMPVAGPDDSNFIP